MGDSRLARAFLGLSLVLTSWCAEVPQQRVVVARRTHSHNHWEREALDAGGSSLTFTVYLKQQNLDKLHSLFDEVSDPDSPRWGQFLTKAELDRLVFASPEVPRPSFAHNAQRTRRTPPQTHHSRRHDLNLAGIRCGRDLAQCLRAQKNAHRGHRRRHHEHPGCRRGASGAVPPLHAEAQRPYPRGTCARLLCTRHCHPRKSYGAAGDKGSGVLTTAHRTAPC